MKNRMSRKRAYNGQIHTVYGKRGKTKVKGLTMRDICDCYIRGLLISAPNVSSKISMEAMKGERADLDENDLYGFDLNKIDAVAIMQNMMCEVEKMMGIYPNVPKVLLAEPKDEIKELIVEMKNGSKIMIKESKEKLRGNAIISTS